MKLVLVRHLATTWNLDGRLQGHRDIPLAPLDSAARTALESLRASLVTHGPFDAIFCSTLQRTRQTAELCGFEAVREDPLLDELDFGKWEGARREEFLASEGDAWRSHPETLAFGETMRAFEARVRHWMSLHKGSASVLAFGHGAWMRAARAISETGQITTMNRSELVNSAVLILRPPSD